MCAPPACSLNGHRQPWFSASVALRYKGEEVASMPGHLASLSNFRSKPLLMLNANGEQHVSAARPARGAWCRCVLGSLPPPQNRRREEEGKAMLHIAAPRDARTQAPPARAHQQMKLDLIIQSVKKESQCNVYNP